MAARTKAAAKKPAPKRKPAAKKPAATKKIAAQAAQHPTTTRIAQVPDKAYYEEYIGRKISKSQTDDDVFTYAHRTSSNVLIEGPTGPGKTSAVLAWAAKHKKAFYAIPSNIGVEPSQLFGRYIPTTSGAFAWQDGPVTDIIRHGGVLLINEVNFMPERVATVLFQLLDKRREITLLDHKSEVITGHEDLLIVADMNPEYEGTRPLNKAFRNRFSIQLFWDYDERVEKRLVSSSSLLEMASRLRQSLKNDEIETPVSTNMLQEFEMIAQDVDVDFALLNFMNHFTTDERPAVEVVVQAFQGNLEADYDEDDGPEDTDDDTADDDYVFGDDDDKQKQNNGEFDWFDGGA